MNHELRHGKYTEDELIEIMLERITEFEREIINEALVFLDLKLNDFIFSKEETVLNIDNSNNINKTFESEVGKRIKEKTHAATDKQQISNVIEFLKIIPNILYEYHQFCKEINDVKGAIEGQEQMIKNNSINRRRLNSLYPDSFDLAFNNMKEEIVELKKVKQIKSISEKVDSIFWNREEKQLDNLSIALYDLQFTNKEMDFKNAILKAENCTIRNEHFESFVMLIYRLAETETPFIKSNMKSGRGAIKLAEKIFQTENEKNLSIQFASTKSKILSGSNLKNINKIVDKIISKINQ